jgi:hypothetical protein
MPNGIKPTRRGSAASRYIRKPSRLDEFLNLGLIFKAALSEPGR